MHGEGDGDNWEPSGLSSLTFCVDLSLPFPGQDLIRSSHQQVKLSFPTGVLPQAPSEGIGLPHL